MKKRFLPLALSAMLLFTGLNSVFADSIEKDTLLTPVPSEYEKVEFDLNLVSAFTNPYSQAEIKLDMVLTAPSARTITLPCFYVSGTSEASAWKSRFAPQESGTYSYYFKITKSNVLVATSGVKTFVAAPSAKKGILHKNNNWSFKYDNGEIFRGIGENVGWEARNFENQTYKYEYFLPKLAANGANFFRTWMHVFNMPLEWKTVKNTNFYSSSTAYFNPSAIKRIDKFFVLIDSLNMHAMMAMDVHGAFLDDWAQNNYNTVNGGPCATPLEFFTLEAAKAKYKDRLRYIIARWGYSPGIGAFEFFNELDNASYSSSFGAKYGSAADASITAWHTEMSKYIKDNDPYGHLVTTSISHREISGLNNVPDIDFNQKHIYWGVTDVMNHIRNFTQVNKPYVIGEFGFSADGAYTNDPTGAENDYTFRRGLWYGIISTTPILPMTWWWEAFDSRNMTPYFRGVREISDQMLAVSKGNMTQTTVTASGLEAYAVKCGNRYYIYVLNSGTSAVNTSALLTVATDGEFTVKAFKPADLIYTNLTNVTSASKKATIPNVSLASRAEVVYIVAPVDDILGINTPYSGTPSELPGMLEAENYDNGGEGVAFHEFDPTNTTGKYRTSEAVDIEEKTGGGYLVTNTVKGEWTEYTVNVVTGASFTLQAMVSAPDASGSFSVWIDGKDVTGKITVPKTAGIQDWTTVSAVTQPISKGVHTLRIVWETSGINLDNLSFTVLNKLPLVSITSPQNASTVTMPYKVDITAEATDEDGSVTKVEFYNGSTKLGQSLTAPYTYSWTPTVGTASLIARATDNTGAVASSTPVTLTVNASTIQLPYATTAYSIPGKIEAENYDLGAEGVAYHDLTTGNKFNVYRTESVDIETCTETGGGYDLGDFEAGEWVEYTVNVEQDGDYDFDFRVASNQSGTSFHMLIDEVNVTSQLTVPATGGWQSFVNLTATGIPLTAGQKVIRLYCDKGYFNTNYLNARLSDGSGLTQSVIKVGFYPNPVKQLLTIENSLLEASEARIFNVLGKLVDVLPINQQVIDFSGLPSGIYCVVLLNNKTNDKRTITVIKE